LAIPSQLNRTFSTCKPAFSELQDESFIDIAAPVLTLGDAELDLTPEELRMQQTIEEQGRQVSKLGILSLVLLILIFALFFCENIF